MIERPLGPDDLPRRCINLDLTELQAGALRSLVIGAAGHVEAAIKDRRACFPRGGRKALKDYLAVLREIANEIDRAVG